MSPEGTRVSRAKVAKLVDALDLGSSGATRESSSLSFRTKPGPGWPVTGGSSRLEASRSGYLQVTGYKQFLGCM